jgi:ABC-type Zn uptake system ZnuABC Zn-binding protein ZnuA
MNIAKYKEIVTLREELNYLEKEYYVQQAAVVDVKTDELLTEAVKEFIEYMKAEGFEVDGDENAILSLI